MKSTTQPKLLQLTPKVRAVVMLLLEGKSNKEIANTLNITIKTVEQHLTLAYMNFAVDGRVQLVLELLK
ncbi:helix-turn-helix transcriptional regulator [Herpetosiphon llansteffanensis]